MDGYNIIPGQDGNISIKPSMEAMLLDEARHESLDRAALSAQFPGYFNYFNPKIDALLDQRTVWQQQIDDHCRERREKGLDDDPVELLAFMREIGYIPPDVDGRTKVRDVIDSEIELAGLESISPLLDENMSLGGANGRWVDYVRALQLSNLINGREDWQGIANKIFGRLKHVPIQSEDGQPRSWENVMDRAIVEGKLVLTMRDGTVAGLSDPRQLVGYTGEAAKPASLVFKHHGLHIEPKFDDRSSLLFSANEARISGLDVEAHPKGIKDWEDGSSMVGTERELKGYRTSLQLDKGTFAFQRAGEEMARRMVGDRDYFAPDGTPVTLRGRTLLQTRLRGLVMKTDSILDKDGKPGYEFLQDLLFAGLSGKHDIEKADGEIRNSNAKKIYVVMPKLEGPEEVAMFMEAKRYAEQMCGLPKHTIKLFLMDESLRTTLTLEQCMAAGIDREDGIQDIVEINTGYLDWFGDYTHTFLERGPIAPKNIVKAESVCIHQGYEPGNVATGIRCEIPATGKGMATATQLIDQGLASKFIHARAGANGSWPHSPYAGAVYVEAWHEVDVAAIRAEMAREISALSDEEWAARRDQYRINVLTYPFAKPEHLTPEAVKAELADNVHTQLGYADPWVHREIGCSSIPDKKGTSFMEDGATVLGSRSVIRNREHYGHVTNDDIRTTALAEAAIIDERNARLENYRPMGDNPDDPALQAVIAMDTDPDRNIRHVQQYMYAGRIKARQLEAA